MLRSMRLALRVVAVVLLGLFAGCGPPQSPVVGTWTGAGEGMQGESGTMVFTFNPDGTMTQTLKSGPKSYEVKGIYKASEGRMTQTLTSYTIDGETTTPPSTTREVGYIVNGPEMVIGVSMSQNIKLKKVE